MNIQHTPLDDETSNSESEGRKSDDGGCLGFSYFTGEFPRLGTAPLR